MIYLIFTTKGNDTKLRGAVRDLDIALRAVEIWEEQGTRIQSIRYALRTGEWPADLPSASLTGMPEMDPNACLNKLLEAANNVVNYREFASSLDAETLADYVLALDEWIRKGGALPDAWKQTAGSSRQNPSQERITVVEAGVGPGHPKDACSFCGRPLTEKETIATCTATAFVTLCPECYDKAGNDVR